MRLTLTLALAAIGILATGCTSTRTDTAAIKQRVHDQVIATARRTPLAVDTPAEAADLVREIQRAKRDVYLLSLADPSDPAVAAAQAVAAARLGVLSGYHASWSDVVRGQQP